MNQDLIALLTCPVCHSELHWTIHECNGERVEEAEAHCNDCSADYPVHEGIGVFLTSDLPRHDLWEEAGGGLTAYLHEHPQIGRSY